MVPSLIGLNLAPRFVETAPLSSGLPDRYRYAFTGVLGAACLLGLVVLRYKIRTADPDTMGDREVTSKLERRDLLEGGEPANTLEWIIQVANRPMTFALGIGFLLALGTVLLVLALSPTLAAVVFFGTTLFALMAFLRFGWPSIETYYERRQPDDRDPHSIRFQGFTTDVMIFLTLFVATLVGLLVLIGIETAIGS